MAQDSQTKPATASRRRIILRRRRKLPVIRLGGSASDKPKRGMFILRMVRRMRLRWLKLRYVRMIKKLKQYYRDMVKDFMDASASLESFQQRALAEASFASLGLAFTTFPSMAVAGAAADHGRKIHGLIPLSPPRRNYKITPMTPSVSGGLHPVGTTRSPQ
ncbi:hypothetical protein Pint_29162 [Pistacia integerrima]|uniref:Uncharacterized protein n=1 Tax=Pistacia integerrima TaxID=434235 RepID=A0ACC0X0B8_9ROSI|nr:hypothetical protein Pint_29162 [Pistacia integerrima]